MAKHKILVVDDEESLCEILQFNLEVEGYEADVAYSAEQALRMHPERYSLILLDVMMGEMSGFRMAQLLKADPETARVPVIFCTAKDSEDDTVAGLNIGADDYITKPFSVREVLARGTGYTIRRHSESTDRNYFYSAMRGDRYIVRSAVPYSVPLGEILAADREFLWFMLGVTLLMSVAGYFATRRLGQNITRLNEFAERAERGERIDDLPAFPHDELGEISSHIIRLYARLQKTTADRDREHALALHEEQEKIRIKKQLTNNINHELKTPVAAIQGYLETLLANPSLDAQRRTDFLEKSAAQTERLRRLLADISTITRMDEASQLIQKERVVLNDLIAEVTADMELKPADQRLRVNIDFPQQVEIVGSPSLLASIFRNLADNAAAYSGGRDIFIRLLSDTPEECTVSFADNGIGIGEEHLPHIFERFYRIDKGRSRKQGGTGLGLAIVKNAVAIHGGTITARERERGGLEFVFTLKKHS